MSKRVKSIITTALELAGLALIVTGVALIWLPAAFIVAGVGLVGVSYLIVGGRR